MISLFMGLLNVMHKKKKDVKMKESCYLMKKRLMRRRLTNMMFKYRKCGESDNNILPEAWHRYG